MVYNLCYCISYLVISCNMFGWIIVALHKHEGYWWRASELRSSDEANHLAGTKATLDSTCVQVYSEYTKLYFVQCYELDKCLPSCNIKCMCLKRIRDIQLRLALNVFFSASVISIKTKSFHNVVWRHLCTKHFWERLKLKFMTIKGESRHLLTINYPLL